MEIQLFIPGKYSTKDIPKYSLSFVNACLQQQEFGDALLFAEVFRGRVVSDSSNGDWYIWQGHYWQLDKSRHIFHLVSGVLASIYMRAASEVPLQKVKQYRRKKVSPANGDEEIDIMTPMSEEQEADKSARESAIALQKKLAARASAICNLRRTESIIQYAAANLTIDSSQWDTKPYLLGTKDGTIDLKTGKLEPGNPDDYVRTIIPTKWTGLNTPCPRFELFMNQIFGDRPEFQRVELVSFLQRTLGYGLMGITLEHIFLLMFGDEGRNGKDTLMSLLKVILGDIVGAIDNDAVISTGRLGTPGGPKSHLLELHGKRMGWASEPQEGARFDVAQVKYLTGGGEIVGRRPYDKYSTAFQPTHLLLLLTNHKPHASAKDKAFWERLCPVVFTLRFIDNPTQPNERKKDKDLGTKLKEEQSGILAWLVRGCIEYQTTGLQIPRQIIQARRTYQGEEDTMGAFILEICVESEGYTCTAGELYTAYKNWCEDNGIRSPMTNSSFGKEIVKTYTKKRSSTGYIYHGLGLQAAYGPRPDEDESEDMEQLLEDVQAFLRFRKEPIPFSNGETLSPDELLARIELAMQSVEDKEKNRRLLLSLLDYAVQDTSVQFAEI